MDFFLALKNVIVTILIEGNADQEVSIQSRKMLLNFKMRGAATPTRKATEFLGRWYDIVRITGWMRGS